MKRLYHLIGIIILVVILTKIDFLQVLAQFKHLNLGLFIMVNLLILPSLFIRSYRWRCLLRLQGINYSARDSFLSYVGGIYVGIITPGRVGETVRALYLKRDKNISFSESLASVFMDRVIDLYLLVFLGTTGFLYFLNAGDMKERIFISLAALFLLTVPFLLLNRRLLEKLARAVYKVMISGIDKSLFDGQFMVFFSSVRKIITKGIYIPFMLTIAAYLIYFMQCYLLARLISINISYAAVVSFVAISSLASLLPITILGIGTRDAALIYLFSLVGIKAESALAYSFLLFLSFYVVSGLLAFFGWFIKGRNIISADG